MFAGDVLRGGAGVGSTTNRGQAAAATGGDKASEQASAAHGEGGSALGLRAESLKRLDSLTGTKDF